MAQKEEGVKRSDFVAKLHDKEDPWVTSVVELAEAAGVVWDPEEEPLPEKLVQEAPGSFSDGRRDVLDISLAWTGEAHAGSVPMDTDERRIFLEAVRRYNLLPELRRRVVHLRGFLPSGCDADDEAHAILALLDGEP